MCPSRSPLVFLLGPSGSGKSTLGAWLASDLDFRHVEVDRWSASDGIDAEGIRSQWNGFLFGGNAQPLADFIRRRSAATWHRGTVLSFPSTLVLALDHFRALAQEEVRLIILWGTEAECMQAFLQREAETGRRLDAEHWRQHNQNVFSAFSQPAFQPWRLLVFEDRGHRPRNVLVAEVQGRLVG